MIHQYLESVTAQHMDFDFTRSQKMAEALSKQYPLPSTILIGGTNGKGSTTAFLSNILQAHGKQVGNFTSPHLLDVRERITVNNHMISDKDFQACGAEALLVMKDLDLICTYFETLTWIAWIYFAQKKLDFHIFEVGLGGRLDSTNALSRIGTIITKIDLDHMKILGPNLESIAKEKLAIQRPGQINIIAKQDPCLDTLLLQNNNMIHEGVGFSHSGNATAFTFQHDAFTINSVSLGLRGDHQATNASLALAMALPLLQTQNQKIDANKVKRALASTQVDGRLQTWTNGMQKIILDIAHNPSSIKALVSTLKNKLNLKQPHILFGCSQDKDAEQMIDQLKIFSSHIYTTSFSHPRSISRELTDFSNETDAFKYIISHEGKVVICTGSIFFIASLYPLLKKHGFEMTRS